jgi:RNA polymerase sigma factor (sigma-70 family)
MSRSRSAASGTVQIAAVIRKMYRRHSRRIEWHDLASRAHEIVYRALFLYDPDRFPATSFTTYVVDSVSLQLPRAVHHHRRIPGHGLARSASNDEYTPWIETAVADHREPEPPDTITIAEALRGMRQALDALPARERTILNLRYGLEDGEPRSYREIAREMSLSPEGVRQLEHSALRRCRIGIGVGTPSTGNGNIER